MGSVALNPDNATYRYDYKIHPLANLFPEMSAEDFKKLKRDIELNGQAEPIMLSTDGETLLDGRHRLRACKELGRLPRKAWLDEQFNGKTSAQSEADYIWSKNVLRRHLTADQRAAIALKWSDGEKEAAKERQKAGLKKGDKLPVRADSPTREKSDRHATRNALAKSAQTSTHKIRQAETVKKKAPHLVQRVAAGEVKLKDAVKMAAPSPRVQGNTETAIKTLVPATKPGVYFKSLQTAFELMPDLLKSIETYRKKHIDPRQYEEFNTLMAEKLELVAKQLRTTRDEAD